jgi:hypothetical protein
VAILGLVAAALQPVTTSADSTAMGVHIMPTRAVAAQRGLGAYSTPNLIIPGRMSYHGGPVMQSTSTTYSIFWQPTGTYMSPNYQTLINRYFGDIGGSVVYANNRQYYQVVSGQAQAIQNSSSFGGTWTDTSPYPSATLSDFQVQLEVIKAIVQNHWTLAPTHIFFVYLAKGENTCLSGLCSFSTFCAYHGYFTVKGTNIYYANMPYAGTSLFGCGTHLPSPNGDADADAEINITSHEHNEAVTDPVAGTYSATGWYDASGNEIGDKCAYQFNNVQPSGQDVVMNGHPYTVQSEWSNSILGCPAWD